MSSREPRHVTVRSVLEMIFPDGTCNPALRESTARVPRNKLATPPEWPPDLFGIAAYLLHEAAHFQSVIAMDDKGPGAETFGVVISEADRSLWAATGLNWAREPKTPDLVRALWDQLLKSSQRPLRQRRTRIESADTQWLKVCMALLAIADEACSGVGFDESNRQSWVGDVFIELNAEFMLAAQQWGRPDEPEFKHQRQLRSLTDMASPEYFAVQPKSRTPQVGATTRTLSHNLALLPPPRRLSSSWINLPVSSDPSPTLPAGDPAMRDQVLNLLLVPFPYSIPDAAFKHTECDRVDPAWGWFEVDPGYWLPADSSDLKEFALDLAIEARRLLPPGQSLHGVVFPELSLEWKHHIEIAHALAAIPELGTRFLVTGSSENCDGERGNFEITSTFARSDPGQGPYNVFASSRPKHHRWRLHGSQILEYGLGDILHPTWNWWERIELRERAVHTHAFGPESHFTVLICEDLARADPVHELVRALGPSLVICLLMDSAQIAQRWPGRYAMSLSEDPGSSVLTLTSRALLERSNNVRAMDSARGMPSEKPLSGLPARRASQSSQSWAVALWRDEEGPPVELHCAPGDHAILLRLKGKPVRERTFDGRVNEDSIKWVFQDALTVRLARQPPAPRK